MLGALATVRNSVVPVYTTVVSSMDLNNKKTFESLEEVCEFLMDFCNDKSVHTISNRRALMHTDSGKPYDLNHFCRDEKRGSGLNVKMIQLLDCQYTYTSWWGLIIPCVILYGLRMRS